MKILTWPAVPGQPPGVALLFGSGLIGTAVARALKRWTGATVQSLPWRWDDAGAHDAKAVEHAALAALRAHPGAKLSVIWAAGRSGFGSNADVMVREAEALGAILDTGQRILEATLDRTGALHHLSSAGGLFEGQTACGPNAVPHPLRPYGTGKLAQEHMVANAGAFAIRHIYRPSSVYGYVPGGRHGLVSAMMTAALERRPVRIVGALGTQRDYIHADDVGHHIAATVRRPGNAGMFTSLLAQARPASIFEMLHLVEARIGLPIPHQLDPRPDNARDTTFLRAALPAGFRPTPLAEGVARIALTLRRDHFGAAA